MGDRGTPRLSDGLRTIRKGAEAQTNEAYNKDTIRQNYSRDRDLSKVTVIPAAPVPSLFDSHKKQRVAVYCRVSTDGIQQTTSFELQRKYYLKYVRKKPEWTLVAMYSDEGISATNTTHRIGLLQMLEDARAGKFDIIVVKNLSRLSRNLMDCMNIVKELRNLEHPVGILFETENMYTLGENMDFTIQILSLVAQEESHKKSEAMNASYKQRFEQGIFMVPDLLGYDRVGVNKIAVNPEEAKTVQLIFMMYLAAIPLKTIAEVLVMLQRKTHVHVFKDGSTKGGEVRWTASSVRNVLKNERRCGNILAQKTYTPDYLTHKSVANKNKLPQYYAVEQHEAIVSPADFLIAQRMLRASHPGWRYGLPALQVHRDGMLGGFVTAVPQWTGFGSEDYNRASLNAYGVPEERLEEIAGRIEQQEQRALLHMQEELRKQASWDDDFVLFADDEEQHPEEQEEPKESFYARVKSMGAKLVPTVKKEAISRYDLSDCELVRPQLFSLSEKAYFTLDGKGIQFNRNCAKKMYPDGKAASCLVKVCYNPVERILVVYPANKESTTTLRWCSEQYPGKVTMRRCGCRGLARAVFENMSWNEEFKYRILGSRIELEGKTALAFYLDEPIIVVPTKRKCQNAEKSEIISKEVLPMDTEEIAADDIAADGVVEKTQSRSRAIYFDDFAAKEDSTLHLSDLGDDLYKPECIQRLIHKGTVPVEGWGYLNGMAKLDKHGFTILPEEWSKHFGTTIYERQSNKMEQRAGCTASGTTAEYGWTVGLRLPTLDTVNRAIDTLRDEMLATL